MMERVNRLFFSKEYQELFEDLQSLEKDRIFCRHNLEHFLDTGRLMYIEVLEKGLDYSKELVYTLAILHDLGRVDQIRNQIPHEIAGAEHARRLMQLYGYTKEEISETEAAILSHRNKNTDGFASPLGELLYKADKKSRNCYACPAAAECNWPEEKRNRQLF